MSNYHYLFTNSLNKTIREEPELKRLYNTIIELIYAT